MKLTNKKQLDKFRADGVAGRVEDGANPAFMFNGVFTKILVAIAKGDVDAQFLAKVELANRGFDAAGKWVGFHKAAKIHGLV